MATHSSVLAWRIPWTKEPGRLYSPWSCKGLNMTEGLTHTIVTEGLRQYKSTRGKKIKHIQIEKEEVKHFIKN